MGAKITLRGNRNDVKEWLPPSYRETGEYKWFQKNFANETFVLVSWDGCTLDDERLKILTEKLMPDRRCADAGPEAVQPVCHRPIAVDQMTGPPLNLSETEAITPAARLADRPRPKTQQTCAVFTLSPAGKELPRKAVERIYNAALESGVPQAGDPHGRPAGR